MKIGFNEINRIPRLAVASRRGENHDGAITSLVVQSFADVEVLYLTFDIPLIMRGKPPELRQ